MRPNSDGECPSNTQPCSGYTSPENTICIESSGLEAKKEKDCPIIDIKLINSAEAESYTANFYEVIDFQQDDLKLAYTKISADSLPIQSTKLSKSTPCYIPYETPSVNSQFLDNEIDG